MTRNEPAVLTGSVMMNREVAAGIFLISFRLPDAFPTPVPGQFVMIKAGDGHDPLLRRPFSIHSFLRGQNDAILEILYRVVGQGTRQLSSLVNDTTISIMGPLGKGFTIIPAQKDIVMVAGGMGIAPLSYLIQHYTEVIRRGANCGGLSSRLICYVGAARAELLVGLKAIESCCANIWVSTDDGSCGYQGNVIELLRRDLTSYHPADSAIYACGPVVMLKELAKSIPEIGFFCQVSMEERMACGLGACLGCAVAVNGRAGQMTYQRVCKDGPVFNIQDVVWQV